MADETSLTQDFLSKLQVSFDADPKNALLQNYSVKNGIKEACLSAVECNKKVHLYNCTLSSKSSPVTNQQGSGRCWIFAMLNVARLPIIKKYGLEGFEFSQTYLHFWDKVERANYLLETFIKTKGEPLEGLKALKHTIDYTLCTPCVHDPLCMQTRVLKDAYQSHAQLIRLMIVYM